MEIFLLGAKRALEWSGGVRTIQGATRGFDGGTHLGLVCLLHPEAPPLFPQTISLVLPLFPPQLGQLFEGTLGPLTEVWTKALWYIMMTVPLLCCFIINHPEIQL